MLGEVAIAVFTLNPTLYERLVDSVRGAADRGSQFSHNDRMDSLQTFAGDAGEIIDSASPGRWTRRGVRGLFCAVLADVNLVGGCVVRVAVIGMRRS